MKEKLHQIQILKGLLHIFQNFAFSVLWMMGEIIHFLKINSAILEFKMSSIDKVLWKLAETWRSGVLASGSDLNHVVSMVTALVLTSKRLLSHVQYPMIFLMSAWAKELFSLWGGGWRALHSGMVTNLSLGMLIGEITNHRTLVLAEYKTTLYKEKCSEIFIHLHKILKCFESWPSFNKQGCYIITHMLTHVHASNSLLSRQILFLYAFCDVPHLPFTWF